MSLAGTAYNALFKRNSIFVGSIFFGAFAFGMGFDTVTTRMWESHNRGKLWADIRDKAIAESNEE